MRGLGRTGDRGIRSLLVFRDEKRERGVKREVLHGWKIRGGLPGGMRIGIIFSKLFTSAWRFSGWF